MIIAERKPKQYKEIKKTISGTVTFYMDNQFQRSLRYNSNSIRKALISNFTNDIQRLSQPHTFHYIIIPD